MGTKGKPFYRIVVADSRSPRGGRFIEIVGTYDPRTDPGTINVDEEKILKWLSCGAQPSDTARGLLKRQGVLEKFQAPKPAKKAKAEAKPAAEAEAAVAEATEVAEEPAGEEKKPATRRKKTSEATTTAAAKKTAKPKAEEEEPAPAAEVEAATEEQPTEEQG